MLQSANLNEDNASLNYGIFEGDDRNIILKLELPAQLSEKQSDLVAHNLSEDLFGLGYNDFDIEISTDEVENNPTLESNDWHNIVNERAFEIVGLQDGNNNFLRGKQVNQNLPYVMATMQGRLFKIHADTALLNKFLTPRNILFGLFTCAITFLAKINSNLSNFFLIFFESS